MAKGAVDTSRDQESFQPLDLYPPGYARRECGDHWPQNPTIKTMRLRCLECNEWCYPEIPCRGCELPMLREEIAEVKAKINWAAQNQCGCLGGFEDRDDFTLS